MIRLSLFSVLALLFPRVILRPTPNWIRLGVVIDDVPERLFSKFAAWPPRLDGK